MVAQLTDGTSLIQEIMRLTEDAARFHSEMAGHVAFPESFIRDWVAVRLCKDHKFSVTIETGRPDFRTYVVDESKKVAHDLLDVKNYKLDMIVWEGMQPRAIVEFKRSTDVADDLVRTAAILSVVPEKDLHGYLVVCEALGTEAGSAKERHSHRVNQLMSMTAGHRYGNVLFRDPAQIKDGNGMTYCGVFAVEVAPSGSQR